jgi:ribose transport system ATP-binding protein
VIEVAPVNRGALVSPTLTLDRVSKQFGNFVALDGVSLELVPGQIHALLGANGSGKSTLVKVVSGVYSPDAGAVLFESRRVGGVGSPAEAAARGIRVVHQEAPLIDTMSVMEAVAIFRGFGAANLGPVPWRRLRRQVQQLLDRMNLPIDAGQQCDTVRPADRAGLALAIVVGDLFDESHAGAEQVKLLIVDEVTASIPEAEAAPHLERLRAVADMGVAVLMVTHRLGELNIADDITVLRAGKVVYREAGGARRSNGELVAEMIGPVTNLNLAASATASKTQVGAQLKRLWDSAPNHRKAAQRTENQSGRAIRVEMLTGSQLNHCSFSAAPGEIVGFAGLRGSGVEELPRLLSGDESWRSGRVEIGGTTVDKGGSPRAMIRAGLAAIPADRLRAGGVASLSINENIILPAQGDYWHKPSRRSQVVESVIAAFDVRPPKPRNLFGTLSGGNQQKVLLGKWLLLRPSVLVLDDPTYGVDPAAREAIFEAVEDAARRGVCVLFLSTEPEQLMRICDRVLVLRDGEIVTELSGPDLVLESVVEWSSQ